MAHIRARAGARLAKTLGLHPLSLRPSTVALLLLPALLASCGGDGEGKSSADAALLEGPAVDPRVRGRSAAGRGGRTAERDIRGRDVSGSTGCNRYTAGYTIDGNALGIAEIATTRMACPPPADTIELAYLAALGQVAEWRSEKEELLLVDADGAELLRYGRATPVGSWQVTGLLSGDAFVTTLGGTELTATFGDDGSLTGSSGCKTYTSAYTIDKGAIEIEESPEREGLC